MIQELNQFLKVLKDKYGDSVGVKEVTITDCTAKLIPHVGPGVGENLDIHCETGLIRIWNGGNDRLPSLKITGPVTDGGYEYKILDEVPGFIRGEVKLPTGEWIEVSWDAQGNVFHLGGWPGNIRALCKLPVGAIKKELAQAAEPEPVKILTFPSGAEYRIEESGSIVSDTPPVVLQPVETARARTVAGYEAVILERREMGFVAGFVQLPNGEKHGAVWDSDGDDCNGRTKFKLLKGF